MSSPPPYITYRVIHAESSGVITEEGIHAGYSTCHGLGNNSIIHPYRFNNHMNRDNRGVRTLGPLDSPAISIKREEGHWFGNNRYR